MTVESSLSHKHARIKIVSDKDFTREAQTELDRVYGKLEDYVALNPFYGITYSPLSVKDDAPEIAREMSKASFAASVGPMAAVAGAIAEHIGKHILGLGAKWVIVENGGDIYLSLKSEKKIGVHAGESPFSGKIAFKIKPEDTPLGVCTSAATVGHSVSLGEADAVVALAKSTPLADAAATAIANEVRGKNRVKKALGKARSIKGLNAVLIITGNELATWGKLPEII